MQVTSPKNNQVYRITPAEANAFYEEHVLGAIGRLRDEASRRFKPFSDPMRFVGSVLLELINPWGEVVDAHMGFNLVVNAGKDLVVDRLQGVGGPPAVADYIAIGTGTNAAAAGDTALQTEVARGQGTLSQPTSTTDRSVYTFAAGTGTGAITEAGRLNAAASGTLLGRIVFSVVTKGALDTLQVTYDLTVS